MTGLVVGFVRQVLTLDQHLLDVLIAEFDLIVQPLGGRSPLGDAEALSLLLRENLKGRGRGDRPHRAPRNLVQKQAHHTHLVEVVLDLVQTLFAVLVALVDLLGDRLQTLEPWHKTMRELGDATFNEELWPTS